MNSFTLKSLNYITIIKIPKLRKIAKCFQKVQDPQLKVVGHYLIKPPKSGGAPTPRPHLPAPLI